MGAGGGFLAAFFWLLFLDVTIPCALSPSPNYLLPRMRPLSGCILMTFRRCVRDMSICLGINPGF